MRRFSLFVFLAALGLVALSPLPAAAGSSTASASRSADASARAVPQAPGYTCPPANPVHCDDYGNAPIVTTYPPQLRPGMNFLVGIEGCAANVTVTYKLGSLPIGSALTNSQGKNLSIVQVPDNQTPGTYTLTGQCGLRVATTQVVVAPSLILSKYTLQRNEYFLADVFGCAPFQPMVFQIGPTVVRVVNAPYWGGPAMVVLRIPGFQPFGNQLVKVTCGLKTFSRGITVVAAAQNVSSVSESSGGMISNHPLPLAVGAGLLAIVGIYLAPWKNRKHGARRTATADIASS